jgi:hypothetical protein
MRAPGFTCIPRSVSTTPASRCTRANPYCSDLPAGPGRFLELNAAHFKLSHAERFRAVGDW